MGGKKQKNKKTKKMTLRFSKKIYSEKAIKKTTQQFKRLAFFRIKKTANYFVVNISNIRIKPHDNFSGEFGNAVLINYKNR